MKIEKKIVNTGHGALTSFGYLVIHETANAGATALNHVNLYSRGYDYAVHFVADWNQIVYQCMELNRIAWHVGNGNNKSVGIELCHATNQSDFNKVWDVGVWFAAQFLKQQGWDVSHMISHNEARQKWGGTTHTDPDGYFAKFGKTWSQFRTAVASKLKEDAKPSTPSQPTKPADKPVEKKKPTQVAGSAKNNIGLKYRSHVQDSGTLAWVHDGQTSGTTGFAARLEALQIDTNALKKIKGYEKVQIDALAHIQDVGDKTYKNITTNTWIGTTGESKRLEGLELQCKGLPSGKHLKFQVHEQDKGWSSIATAGEIGAFRGSVGEKRRVEAVRIWIE